MKPRSAMSRGMRAIRRATFTPQSKKRRISTPQPALICSRLRSGRIHGVYASTPVLQYDRIAELREAIPVPLVMHGSSGLEADQFRTCVARGICKINFSTYLQLTAANAIREAVRAAGDKNLNFAQLVGVGKSAGKEFIKAHLGYFGTKPFKG